MELIPSPTFISAPAPGPWERQATEMSTAWAVEGLLAASTRDELEDWPDDCPRDPSEDEGGGDGERQHQRLLEAVTSLAGRPRWGPAERSEAGPKVSEFTVSAEGSGERLVLSDLLEPRQPSPSWAAVRKQLNRVKCRKTVGPPVPQEEAAHTHREVAFHETSRTLSRWDPRRAEEPPGRAAGSPHEEGAVRLRSRWTYAQRLGGRDPPGAGNPQPSP